jgi:outer membrane protein assembly factor BamB
MVIALSSESGDIYWEHRKNGPFDTPPVSDGRTLYLATSDTRARVYALRVVDGSEQWEKRYPGVSAPLILAEDRLYLATQPGLVTALRTRDGGELWQAVLGAPTAAAPVLMDERLLVPSIRDTVYALDVENGAIEAKRPVPARVSAAPAVHGTVVYLPLQSGHVLALEGDELTERWSAHVGGPVLASPVVTEDGTVYVLARSGAVWKITADGVATRLWDLGSAATGALALTADAILVGLLDGRLVALSRQDGSELWITHVGDSVTTPPFVQDGAIYVPLRRGRVVKLR